MKNPMMIIPGAREVMQRLNAAIDETGIPAKVLGVVSLRASRINGCSVCVDRLPQLLRAAGETDERLFSVGAWRDAPYFDQAERAALALTESLTRLADCSDPVPDEVWDEAARCFEERQLGALVLSIGAINVWNRVNAATRQLAGAQKWG